MSKPVPERLVVVVGTGTEVGKTWVACRTLEALAAAGVRVAARKPVQSYDPADVTTDAAELAAATGEERTAVCPQHRWYEVAMAPPMAADALGRPPFTVSDLVDEIIWPEGVALGLVESAGGLRSPMASDDADGVALAAALMPDVVVLVADAGLGTINSIRLAVAALEVIVETRDALDLVIVLNRFDASDELHRRNLAWLEDHDGLTLVTSIDALAELLGDGLRGL
jgi:dethiobiotin synthetase